MVRKRPARLDDEALARLVGEGDAAAFEQLYDRHHRALLAFCRHMLGNREDGEDALQQAFLRAHRALSEGRAPDARAPWLFAIARNRCLTLLAARRDVVAAPEDAEPSFDGLAADVERRSDLKELLGDLSRLPDEQRGALVLAELGDFSHVEIGAVLGCPAGKVKALVFQARTSLIADRDARRAPCDEIRTQLETGRGGVLRRGPLRRHLGCATRAPPTASRWRAGAPAWPSSSRSRRPPGSRRPCSPAPAGWAVAPRAPRPPRRCSARAARAPAPAVEALRSAAAWPRPAAALAWPRRAASP